MVINLVGAKTKVPRDNAAMISISQRLCVSNPVIQFCLVYLTHWLIHWCKIENDQENLKRTM